MSPARRRNMAGRSSAGGGPGRFLRRIAVDETGLAEDRDEHGLDTAAYPFDLAVVTWLQDAGGLDLPAGVTFLVGDNGSGKSTLVEAVAVAAGFNPEGGSRSFRFATRASESPLGQYLTLNRTPGRRERTSFFLRAESIYNVATEIERLDADPDSPPLLPAYGGRSLHERSHGESFLDLVTHRFGPGGLYLLDEPEAALSVHGCLAVLRRIAELTAVGSQFLIATHSPVLLAVPGATILQIEETGAIATVDYRDAAPVTLTRAFLANPERFLHHLLTDEQADQ